MVDRPIIFRGNRFHRPVNSLVFTRRSHSGKPGKAEELFENSAETTSKKSAEKLKSSDGKEVGGARRGSKSPKKNPNYSSGPLPSGNEKDFDKTQWERSAFIEESEEEERKTKESKEDTMTAPLDKTQKESEISKKESSFKDVKNREPASKKRVQFEVPKRDSPQLRMAAFAMFTIQACICIGMSLYLWKVDYANGPTTCRLVDCILGTIVAAIEIFTFFIGIGHCGREFHPPWMLVILILQLVCFILILPITVLMNY